MLFLDTNNKVTVEIRSSGLNQNQLAKHFDLTVIIYFGY